MFAQEFARFDDVPRTRTRVSVNADECVHYLLMIAIHQMRPDGFDRTQPHFRRTSAREKTKDHFFPKPFVAAVFPDAAKFPELCSDLFLTRPMRVFYVLKGHGYRAF